MKKNSIFLFFIIISITQFSLIGANAYLTSASQEIPVLYKGRVRPYDVVARLWLKEIYHQDHISKKNQPAFPAQLGSALEIILDIQLFGIQQWVEAPLFYVGSKSLKKLLNLDESKKHFSFTALHKAIFENQNNNKSLLKALVLYFYSQKKSIASNSNPLVIKELHPELKITQKGNQLIFSSIPTTLHPLFKFIRDQEVITENLNDSLTSIEKNKMLVEESLSLIEHLNQFELLSEVQPWKFIPSRAFKEEWLPLTILKSPDYKTKYSSENNLALNKAWLKLNADKSAQAWNDLAILLNQAYHSSRLSFTQKSTLLPSRWQLKAELLYYQFPWIELTMVLYAVGIFFIFLSLLTPKKILESIATLVLGGAFVCHTFIIGLRCYILERPPVSNMFETVIYVPWVAIIVGFAFWMFKKNIGVLLSSAIAALLLLIILKITDLNSSLENVQAVLNSQYWLIIHVLMIVGSYSLFVLAAIMGHWFLIQQFYREKPSLIPKLMIQLLYIGLALLIPGTLLGGVWAAQSWGRFWDWDPKESWAFISACIYLIFVHAYRFGKIKDFGIAVGAVVGVLAISFTWYGVNYILGTGFHSYGFGSGGEYYYYLYLVLEIFFLALVLAKKYRRSMRSA